MSLRDKRRKQSRQHVSVEAANLEAIAQTIPETQSIELTEQDTVTMTTNTNQEVIATQPQPTTTETGEDMNTNNTPVEVEVELTEDQAVVTTPDTNHIVVDIATESSVEQPTDTVESTSFEVLTEWLGTFEPPKPENLVGLNLHTLTGASLVVALGMPSHIPTNIAHILLEEMKANPVVGNYHGVAEKIVKMYTSEQGVDVAQLMDFGLPLARPYVVTKTKPIMALLDAIRSFLEVPVVEAVAVKETPVEVKASTDKPVTTTVAAEDKTISVTVTISDKPTGNTEVEENKEAESVPVVKGPEDLLAEWVLANPNYTFDQYFNKRNELYLAAA